MVIYCLVKSALKVVIQLVINVKLLMNKLHVFNVWKLFLVLQKVMN